MKELFKAARAIRERAYAPYSKFHVGAALRTPGGRVFSACNVENAAYPLGTCAEAGAIAAMIAAGEHQIVEVAIVGSGSEPCVPCGGCRQRLAEFASADATVHMAGEGPDTLTLSMGELLPHAFKLTTSPAPKPLDAAAMIRAHAGFRPPSVGLVLGSGMGEIVELLEDRIVFAYQDLPGFARSSVAGHAGELVLGRLGEIQVALMRGRMHLYEGHEAAAVSRPVQTLAALGCKTLLLTNAAGSLRPEIGPGSLVLISDHLNQMGSNPLVGQRDGEGHTPFLDLSDLYDRDLRARLMQAARRAALSLHEGVYAGMLGPVFETPAEIRALKTLGADLVGMSTIPEAIGGRQAGMKIVALSVVTNLAAGMTSEPLTHAQTLQHAADASLALTRFLTLALPEIALGAT